MAVVMQQKAGSMAVGAMIAAVLSFIITFTGHPAIGMLSALLAIALGIFGLISAASPRVGGGMMSIAAIVLGVIAIGVAVLGVMGTIIF